MRFAKRGPGCVSEVYIKRTHELHGLLHGSFVCKARGLQKKTLLIKLCGVGCLDEKITLMSPMPFRRGNVCVCVWCLWEKITLISPIPLLRG